MNKLNKNIKELLETNAVAVATISEVGTPHCIAIGFPKVISDSEVLITDNYMNETPKNIQNNSSVSLAVWSRNWENDEECEGYELKGEASYYKEGDLHKKVKSMPENTGMPCKGVILVSVNTIKKMA